MRRMLCSLRWHRALLMQRPLLTGGLVLGLLTAVEGINFNNILFQFLTLLVSLFASVLFGGDVSSLTA